MLHCPGRETLFCTGLVFIGLIQLINKTAVREMHKTGQILVKQFPFLMFSHVNIAFAHWQENSIRLYS